MKFGQLLEYSMRNNFHKEKQNIIEKLFPDTFIQKIKIEHISGSSV